ncbi:MAG: hypothetical protein JSR85_01945 [Proteobacteria bacterium]|nr:hypothetical protein [Pseudomonadota bacterium]
MNISNFSSSLMTSIIALSLFTVVVSESSVNSSIEIENTLKTPIEVKKESASQSSTEPVLIHIKEQEELPPQCKYCHIIPPRNPVPQDETHKAFKR